MIGRQKQMVMDDLSHKRLFAFEDTISILNFCRFVETARAGDTMTPCLLPPEHVQFYRKVVTRLVEAGLLSSNTMELFNTTFSLPSIEDENPDYQAPSSYADAGTGSCTTVA